VARFARGVNGWRRVGAGKKSITKKGITSMKKFLTSTVVALACSAPLVMPALAPIATADNTLRGANGGAETKSTGTPLDSDGNNIANGFGSITSQRAVNDGDIGEHVSTQDSPHLGVGNVARNDAAEAVASGTDATGTRPGNHAVTVGPLVGYDPHTRPGTRETDESP